jgi:protein-disulfide isomerase
MVAGAPCVNRHTLRGRLITGNDGAAHQHCGLRFMATKKRKSYLPFAIIAAVLAVALVAGAFLFQARRTKPILQVASTSKPGAQPPHVRGDANAPVTLEEFGDFECMPCFILWPALRNLEHDYGDRLAVIFRQNPMPQHSRALDAARASEAAGLQEKFWEMHDVLYLQRATWTRSDDARVQFNEFARRLQLDVERFKKDIDGEEVAKRMTADRERGAALGLDRTPVVFINGRRAQLQGDVEKGLRDDIDAALGTKR